MLNVFTFFPIVAHDLHSILITNLHCLKIYVVIKKFLLYCDCVACYGVHALVVLQKLVSVVNYNHHVEQILVAWVFRRMVKTIGVIQIDLVIVEHW